MVSRIVWFSEQGRNYKGPLLGSGLTSLFTVIIGSFFDYFFREQNPLANPTIWIGLFITAFFLFWWGISTDRVYQWLAKRSIRSRFKNAKVGVLSISENDDEEVKSLLRSTDFTPEMWLNHLRSNSVSVEKTTDLSMNENYSILLNPFGELYLEDDTMNLKTFQAIKDYIKKGGVFVNTAGLAFFYMWNQKTKIEGLTGPMLEAYAGDAITKPIMNDPHIMDEPHTYTSSIALQPIVIPDGSSLIDTWLFKNFGIRTSLGDERPLRAEGVNSFRDIIEKDLVVHEFRSALRCEHPECQLIPIIRSEYVYRPTGKKHECYPIAAVKYGLGYLILVGLVLKEDKDLSLVVRTIKGVIEKLRKRGFLEIASLSNSALSPR